MFDKYFCRKFHAKEITLDMLVEKYLCNPVFALFIICANIYFCYLWYLAEGLGTALGGMSLAVVISYMLTYRYPVMKRITVATCPLKK